MDDERRESIGATVRTLREARGQTRRELSSAADISLEMLAKIEQGRKAPSAVTLAALASGLGLEAPELAQRASAWQAFASAGASLAALRAGTIAGTLGISSGAAAHAAFGIGGAYLIRRELRNRRVLEELLRSNLKLSEDDLQDIAQQLGVEMPTEPSSGEST